MDPKQRLILDSERALARRIALAVVVSRPVVTWLQLIPGMFLVDFLRRSREIRRVAATCLPLRQAALEAAAGEETRITDGTWLDDAGFASEEVRRAASEVVVELMAHYRRLLAADGERYEDLVREAYGTRAEYRRYLETLAEREKALRRAMAMQNAGDPRVAERLEAEQEQAEVQRRKELDRIFPL